MIVKANRMICLKSRLNAMQLILDCCWSCAKFKGCWCCKKWVKTVRHSQDCTKNIAKHSTWSVFSHICEKLHSWKLGVTSGIPCICIMNGTFCNKMSCSMLWYNNNNLSFVVDTRKWKNQFGFVSWQAVCFCCQWLTSCSFFSPLAEENSASTIVAANWMLKCWGRVVLWKVDRSSSLWASKRCMIYVLWTRNKIIILNHIMACWTH
jgi:hypothetical protein